MENSSKRNYYIDFLKMVFSIVIVYYHSWVFTGNYGSGYFNRGYYAVDFYFIVTGFLFIKSLEKIYNKKSKDPVGLLDIKFVFNKIKELIPSILFIFIVGYFMVYRTSSINYHITFSDSIITEIFFLGFLGKGMTVNLGCWYISVMILTLFILFPLVYKYKKNFNYLISPLIIILCLGLCNYFKIAITDPLSSNYIFINGVYKGFIFINLGVISYELCNILKKIKFNRFIRIFFTVLETLIYIFLFLNMHYYIAESYMNAILFTFNIALTFSNLSYTSVLFNDKIYQSIGKFGFIFYLSNIPVRIFVMSKYYGSYGKMLLIYWIIIIILSTATYIVSNVILKKIKQLKEKA